MDPVAEREVDAVAELTDPVAEQVDIVSDQQVDAEAAQMVDTATEAE